MKYKVDYLNRVYPVETDALTPDEGLRRLKLLYTVQEIMQRTQGVTNRVGVVPSAHHPHIALTIDDSAYEPEFHEDADTILKQVANGYSPEFGETFDKINKWYE